MRRRLLAVRRTLLGQSVCLPSVVLSLLLAGAFLVLTDGGRHARPMATLTSQLDLLLVRAGLGVNQVALAGHRYTLDSAIYDALALDAERSILTFDAREAKRRLETLPWIESATIVRQLPDILTVQVRERVPLAVWRRSGDAVAGPSAGDRAAQMLGLAAAHLIDASGRVLAPVGGNGGALGLPVVAGDGAPAEAARLLQLLDQHAPLRDRLEQAVRVGDQRWTLRLKGGPVVHLPADGPKRAIERLRQLDDRHALLERAIEVVDLRLADRVTVRAIAPVASNAPRPVAARFGG